MTATPKWDTIAILGVGLIGGSIGLALRQRGLCRRIVGVGRRTSTLTAARRHGAIDAATTQIARGVGEAQLVVVCTPVEQVVGHVLEVMAHCPADTLITDVGSTKSSIVHGVESAVANARANGQALQGRFVGSHPMAGSEKKGVRYASAELFVGRAVIVTPGPTTLPRDVATIERFWRALGGRVTQQLPEAHDAAVAAISHLPHLLASALAAMSPKEHLPLAAGGWRDTTRIAGGDAELWRQILLDNRHEVLKSLANFTTMLEQFRTALEQGDSPALSRLLELGKKIRDAVGN